MPVDIMQAVGLGPGSSQSRFGIGHPSLGRLALGGCSSKSRTGVGHGIGRARCGPDETSEESEPDEGPDERTCGPTHATTEAGGLS
ncbi:MAG: hypothetical protein V9E94_02380 [Microthrixaceae bacterium]